MKYGFSDKQLKKITGIFATFNEIEQAVLFGSRAINTYKEASDIDIAIKGEKADFALAAKLKDHFEEETYLPFFFDIIAYNTISSNELKKHINTKGIVIYNKSRSEWKEYKLGDIAEFKTGKLNSNAATPDGIYPFFTCSPCTLKIDNYAFDEKALLLAGNNANGVFALKYFKGKFNAYQRTYIINNLKNCKYRFLFYALKLQLSNLEFISHGTATKFLTLPILNSIPVLLPPLPEQKAIASVLSSLDDKIALLHRQNKTLEQMAETLFRQWFVEEAKEDWEDGVLSDLVEVKYGKDHKKLLDGSIPVYGSGGIMRYAEKPLFENESVLIPRKGTLNNVTYINEPFWAVDTMFYTIMKKPNLAKFIYHFVKEKDLASMNVGSAVPSMTTQVLNNMQLQIPSNEDLEYFENIVTPNYLKIKSNQTQIRTLEKLRDTLLQKLMSGEVRVSIDE